MEWKALLVLALTSCCTAENKRLREVYSWKLLDFAYENPLQRAADIESGVFKPVHNLPLGVEVWKNKVFITVPRWKDGVPSTLNYIDLDVEKYCATSPPLIPYPDLKMNTISEGPEKNFITSVFRIRIDPCDRLWMIDTGIDDLNGAKKVITPPQILIFDLLTDKLIKKYVLKPSDYRAETSFFGNIIVDVTKDKCDEAFAYLPDLGSYTIVVYDLKKDKSRRIKHHYFHMDPLQGNYNVGGVNFQWDDGVFSIGLTRPLPDGSRTAYFHPLSSNSEFEVNTSVLKQTDPNNELWDGTNFTAYSLVGNKGPESQTTSTFIHEETGVMFYAQIQKDAVYCRNTNKAFDLFNFQEIASDKETLIFPNDLKVDYNDNLWVLSNRLPQFHFNRLDTNDTNFRLFVAPVKDVIKNTACEPPQKSAT